MDLLWKVGSKAKNILSREENLSDEHAKAETSNIDCLEGNEPASPNFEVEKENLEKDMPTESEELNSEQAEITESGESVPLLRQDNESEHGGPAMNSSSVELKDVSQKAVESAKSIGSFLFGIANKTTRTLTETAKHLKTTVEENSILGDFNKEQKAFASSKTINSKEKPLAPWVGTADEENVKQQILSLSGDKRNFLRSPPTGVMYDFNFDTMFPVAMLMLQEDATLKKLRFEIVPKLVNEEIFWRNYFYRVSLVKQSSIITANTPKNCDDIDSSSCANKDLNKDTDKNTLKVEVKTDSDTTDSPNHEFVSDAFNSNQVSDEDIKHGMKMLGVSDKSSKDEDWEKEMQQELQEYEVVEGENEDPDWENEIEEMLSEK